MNFNKRLAITASVVALSAVAGMASAGTIDDLYAAAKGEGQLTVIARRMTGAPTATSSPASRRSTPASPSTN